MGKNLLSYGIWAATGGLLVVGWVLLTGTPFATVTDQVGYRGTGMVDVQPESQAEARAAYTVPESEEPYPPEPGEETAAEFYENVQVLGDLTVSNFNRLMAAMTEWVSPEQGCNYCHGDEGNFASEEYYQKIVSRRMLQMTRHINVAQTNHVGQVGVTCFTCHRGQPVPEHIWFKQESPRAGMSVGADRRNQNRPMEVNGYSSLPVDALEAYLAEAENIRVVSLEPRVPNEGTPDIKDTEKTYSLMMHMADSLGVNCTHCHNSRSFVSWDMSPTARATAWHGIRMARTLNNEYLIPLEPVYPPERLGELGDAPKLNCKTCHQGWAKPLGGQSMLENWPELRTEGAPVYE